MAYDQDLHVHHKTYRNRGAERPEDLQALCRRCHELETYGRSSLVAPKSAICRICGSVHWNPREESCQTCEQVFSSAWVWKIPEGCRQLLEELIARAREQERQHG